MLVQHACPTCCANMLVQHSIVNLHPENSVYSVNLDVFLLVNGKFAVEKESVTTFLFGSIRNDQTAQLAYKIDNEKYGCRVVGTKEYIVIPKEFQDLFFLNIWVLIHYGMLHQRVGTTSWTNMFNQLVPTCLTNERIEYCRICSYSEISVEFLSNLLYQHTCCTNMLVQ
jgi:hypothetical protein